jgi:hypothetical protein
MKFSLPYSTDNNIRLIPALTLATLLVFVFCSTLFAQQVRVLPSEIKETRTTGSFFGGLEVELKVMGDLLSDAKAIRLLLDTAVDETGRNIVNEKETETDFKEISEYERNAAKIDLKLKTPARQAMHIREITGSFEIFVPGKDPASTITITDIQRSTGTPISAPALRAAGIEITMWTKQQFEARRKAEEEKLKKSEKGGDLGEALGQALGKLFGGLFGSLDSLSENSIAFQIKDPQSKLVGIEFQDAKGAAISGSRLSSGSPEDQTRIHDFESKLPDTTRVKLYVLTPRSVVKAPFKLNNIPLP